MNKDDELNYNDLDPEDKSIYSSTPKESDSYDVFNLRNNPQPLIEEFYLYLTNKEYNNDPNAKTRYRQIPNTQPLLNTQGVKDLVSIARNYINNHTVQTNLKTESLNRFMRFRSNDIIISVMTKRADWELPRSHAYIIIKKLVGLIELFLRRGLDDKEREHYSQEQTHEYTNVNTNNKKKGSLRIPEAVGNMFKK